VRWKHGEGGNAACAERGDVPLGRRGVLKVCHSIVFCVRPASIVVVRDQESKCSPTTTRLVADDGQAEPCCLPLLPLAAEAFAAPASRYSLQLKLVPIKVFSLSHWAAADGGER
jgi:hypothetical protein